jgi:hypothetical protein
MRKSKKVRAYIDGLVRCEGCHIYFVPRKPWAKFCDVNCRTSEHRKANHRQDDAA